MKKLISFVRSHYTVCLILAIIFLQNPIWALWYIPYTEISFLFCLLLFLSKRKYISKLGSRGMLPILLLVLMYILYPIVRGGFHGSNFVYILCFIAALSINLDESKLTLEIISKFLGLVVGASVVAWLLNMTVVNFPVIGTIDITKMKGFPTIMENYFFFVQNASSRSLRFYSIFDEPGVLGTLGAYVLFANKYNFKKWYNLSLFIGCLCTMSMAFYALSLVGLVYTNSQSRRAIIMSLLVIGVVLYFAYDFLKEYEEFNDLIVERMLNISGSLDKRTDYYVSDFYDKMSIMDYMFGIGSTAIEEKELNIGASYKTFIIENGLISLMVLMYAYFILNKKNTMRVLVFVALFWASFMQRPTAFNGWQMLMYTCIVTTIAYEEKNKTRYIATNDEKC